MKQLIVLSLLLASSAQALAAADSAVLSELSHARQPQENRIVSGSIDAEDVTQLRAAGIKHVINLRTEQESEGFDEARAVAKQGLDYHSIPIAGAQSLTKENARKLDEILKQVGDEPTLVHCASGNRVGALIAVREAWINGQPTEAAIAEGKRWGLASLEGAVRTTLEGAGQSKSE